MHSLHPCLVDSSRLLLCVHWCIVTSLGRITTTNGRSVKLNRVKLSAVEVRRRWDDLQTIINAGIGIRPMAAQRRPVIKYTLIDHRNIRLFFIQVQHFLKHSLTMF